ncbi:MAG TPA: hypothetical protein ENI08_01170 [Candidatus Dependentiae bacterium]|nr:hypothetical protein [Candidatus Dependentiae bacterium]
MNYRSAFITLIFLLFSYVLVDNKLQCKSQGTSLVKSLALKFGEDFNVQQPKDDIRKFKKDFKARFGQSVPPMLTLLEAAVELAGESKELNLPRAECLKKISGSHFLKTLVHEEKKSWVERHPYYLYSIGFIVGILLAEAKKRQNREPNQELFNHRLDDG